MLDGISVPVPGIRSIVDTTRGKRPVSRPGTAPHQCTCGLPGSRLSRTVPRTHRTDRSARRRDPQVPIYVSIPNPSGRLVEGLFAEGRVVSESAQGLVVPIDAVSLSESEPWVLRVAHGRTERVRVTVGLRDTRTERVQITSGLNTGDILLRGVAHGITPGTAVDVGTASGARSRLDAARPSR
jgi:membrane fusion protein, multidrug efflux system